MSKKIGILDPKGKNKNPLTNKKYSDNYLKLAKDWSKLPAYSNATEIINLIKKNQILLVISGTGSGKTVLMPKYLLHACDYKCKIGVTLPKQLVALSSAEYAAATLDVELGEEIGYKYKGSPKNSYSNKTKILYATDGTIVANLLGDPTLSKYQGIIIDEAHERKIQIDFLLYLLKEVLKKRKDFKLIIMSATINSDVFMNYFKKFKIKELHLSGTSNHPIDSIFLDSNIATDNYNKLLNHGFDILIKILENEKENKEIGNDIVFFVTSQNDTKNICNKLNNYILNCKDKQCDIVKQGNIFCATIYSGLNPDYVEYVKSDVSYLKEKSKKYYRKIIIATNIAESSITLKGLKYVIDSGHELLSSFDYKNMAKILKKGLITVAQAKQRMGRVGRTKPGICYHLYTKNTFENKMKKYPEPSIKTNDIRLDVLRLLNTINNYNDLMKSFSNFIEPPSKETLIYIKNYFDTLGVLTNNKINILGKYIIDLNVSDINHGLCIAYSHLFNCVHEVAIIISILTNINSNINKLFLSNIPEKDKNKLLSEIKKQLYHPYGDHLTLLYIYQLYESKTLKKSYYINENKLNNIIESKLYEKLISKPKNLIFDFDEKTLNIINNLELQDRILISLLYGYRTNTAKKAVQKNKYMTQTKYSDNVKISNSSFISEVANSSNIYPKNIFYSELFIGENNAELNFVGIINEKIFGIL